MTRPSETDKRQAVVDELPRLRRYARALVRDPQLADDLVQDSVERALSRLALFRAGTNMRAWLFTIMHNVHVNAARRRHNAPDRAPLDDALSGRLATAAEQGAAMAARDIGRALDGLPEEQRAVVLLIALEDFSYREAAEVLAVPIGTVMSRLARGREQLRRAMDGAPPSLRRVK